MNKKVMSVAAAALAVSMGVAVTGCSKKDTSSPVASSKKQVTLTVWESLNGPDEFIRKAGEAYTAKNPNVKINFVNVELGDATGQIALDGPAGVGADLFAAPHDKLGELVSSGLVLPTKNADSVKEKVLGACSSALTYDGTMYGYPVSAETYALFYNKNLISDGEVPTTWTELATWAKAFNEKNPGKYGFMMDVGNGYYTIIFTTANGNRLFGASGTDTTSSRLNNADAVNGMKFFQSLHSILNVPAADLTTGTCDASFAAGNAAMHITGLWNVKPFEDAGINFGVAPLPALPGDSNPAASFSGTRAMFVSAFTDYPEEAADFADFLLSEEMQKLRFDLTGAMPAVNVEVSSKYMPGFLRQLEYAFPMPSIPQMSGFWDSMGSTCANIWNGADVQKELDACDSAIVGR